MGQCLAAFHNVTRRQDVTSAETHSQERALGKRKMSPSVPRSDRHYDTTHNSSMDPYREYLYSPVSKRPHIDPRCGADYIQAAPVDSSVTTGVFSRDVNPLSTFQSRCMTPNCPYNTPIPVARLPPPSEFANYSCRCQGDPHFMTSTVSRPNCPGLDSSEVNLNTISAQLQHLTHTLREHSTRLTSLSSDTTKLLDDTQLFITATGSLLDISHTEPSSSGLLSLSSKRVKVFDDGHSPGLPDTPRPMPLPRNSPHMRTRLLPQFDQLASEDAEKETVQSSSDDLNDSNITVVSKSPTDQDPNV